MMLISLPAFRLPIVGPAGRIATALFIALALLACHRHIPVEAQSESATEYNTISTAQLQSPGLAGGRERYWSRGKQYMIASDAPEASRAGTAMYARGGNAVDAAVAVSFAISVVRPQSTGLGGGGFLLVHLAERNETIAYDFRERAPAAASRDMYLDENGEPVKGLSTRGALSVGVPGTIAGLLEVQRRHGKLSRAEVIAPALALAREGFPMYADLQQKIRRSLSTMDEQMQAVFAPGGVIPAVGANFRQPALARTLETISARGERALYSAGGVIARDLDRYMREHGGLVRTADLVGYRVLQPRPLWGEYRGHRIAIMPPPSSGIFILQMLRMLAAHSETPAQAAARSPKNVHYEHLLGEVFRRGYADRAKLGGDPRYFKIPVDLLNSPEYAARRMRDFDPAAHVPSDALAYPDVLRERVPAAFHERGADSQQHAESTETTHFSILDSRGDAVSSTQSVNVVFGARVMLPGWGIVLNDTMDDFSKAPGRPNAYGLIGGEANAIAGGKTPLSSMSPTIVFAKPGERIWNGHAASPVAEGELRPRLVLGSPGGSRIITAILHTIINDIDFGLHPYNSVARGRVHHQFRPDRLSFADSPAGQGRKRHLEERGHTVTPARWQAKVFAVRADAAGFVGVSDPRGDGQPLGDLDDLNPDPPGTGPITER